MSTSGNGVTRRTLLISLAGLFGLGGLGRGSETPPTTVVAMKVGWVMRLPPGWRIVPHSIYAARGPGGAGAMSRSAMEAIKAGLSLEQGWRNSRDLHRD